MTKTAHALTADATRAKVERAFSPDITLRWSITGRCWIPATIADMHLVRRFNDGRLFVKDIDVFTGRAIGFTIETIGQPDQQ